MINFKKNDPITNFINKAYFEISNSNPTANELEKLLTTHENDPIKLVAVGFCYIQKYPMKARGYLCAYDNLFKLGFDGDSLAVLSSPLTQIRYHPLVVARLVVRHFNTRDYSSAWKLVASCPQETLTNLRENSGFTRTIFELTKITKSTIAYDALAAHSPAIDQLKVEIAEKTSRLREHTSTCAETYSNYVKERNFSTADEFSWLAYNAGERSEAFFEVVCKPLATELDISARVMFFRIEAARTFKKNPTFIAYGARTFLHASEVNSAYEITSKAIENSVLNTEVLHLNARASVVLGSATTEVLPEFVPGKSDRNFYAFSLHRKLSKSILTANSNEELHYRNLCHSIEMELHSPLSAICQKTPIYKSTHPRVAICISGQLRGIEKSSKSVISELLDHTNGHLFIDTWKTQRSNFPTFTRVQRLIGNELWNLLPVELKMPDGFRQYLPRTTKKLTSPITSSVTSDYVKNYLPSATVRIEDEEIFEKAVSEQAPKLRLRGNLNQAKMFYKIKKCHELATNYSSDHEMEFDVVIRTRPDLEISFPNIKEYIESAHSNQNVIYVSYLTAVGYGDQFAIGSKKAMDIYSSIWEKVWSSKQFKYSDSFDQQVSAFAGESLMANHLFLHGIDVKFIKPEKSNFTTTLSINSTDIKDDLADDIEACELKPLLEAFHSKYLEMRKSKIAFT
ncbi:hypothetical protein N5D52_28870 [Pseudomonas sp. GD03860]|uniref:hypothetical protein n=1 Tax=Pseudomonas TaxID=286 RepID=UPI002363458D|nr:MULTISPECIES: hypothetical protein [Pseudomonas]MDD2056366.1 hypothetical protein [Pseudomonas putida]MDH0640945.1 hypothetical protein [Pseudomonas sp. GD03860]